MAAGAPFSTAAFSPAAGPPHWLGPWRLLWWTGEWVRLRSDGVVHGPVVPLDDQD